MPHESRSVFFSLTCHEFAFSYLSLTCHEVFCVCFFFPVMLRTRTEIYGAVDIQINSKRCYVTHRKYVLKNPMGEKKIAWFSEVHPHENPSNSKHANQWQKTGKIQKIWSRMNSPKLENRTNITAAPSAPGPLSKPKLRSWDCALLAGKNTEATITKKKNLDDSLRHIRTETHGVVDMQIRRWDPRIPMHTHTLLYCYRSRDLCSEILKREC